MNAYRVHPLRTALGLLVIALVPALLAAWMHPKKPAWRRSGEVTAATAVAWSDALWIDARPAANYAEAHVPGAVNLTPDAWDVQIEAVVVAWSPERRIVVYCDGRSCQASHEVATRLRHELGLANVYVLTGGWQAWRQHKEGGGS
jgi:rhodanese-related sulfurtransferase